MTLRDRYYAYPHLRELAFLFPPLFGWRKAAIKAILQVLQPPPKSLLEVGCGTGILTRRLAHRLPETQITAIDASPAMIQIAQRTPLPNVRYLPRRLEDMEGTYDALVAMHVLPLLPLTPTLNKVRDLLAPQGRAFLTFTSERLLTRLHRRFYRIASGSILTLYPPRRVRQAGLELGFSVHIFLIHPGEGSYLVVLRK